jgi:cyclic pyranopterin phosphate synthase
MRLPVVTFPNPLPLFDTGPRSISAVRVLRISITDRCNFRCVYCMPADGVRWLPQSDILTFEEIKDVVKSAVELHGITRVKLTGGEPTVRSGLVDLVSMLREIVALRDISLTTNGMRLGELGHPLRQAGLDRVTVSIDSLNSERFRKITRTGDLATVLQGLTRAQEAGLGVKINCVTMRGVNDDELVEFARLSLHQKLTVRFIEYMPLGDAELLRREGQVLERSGTSETNRLLVDPSEIGPSGGCGAQDRGQDSLVPEAEARERIEKELGPLEAVMSGDEPGVGPAKVFRLAQGNPVGRIGFISAMSAPFCATCNRLRLTATGVLRSCLFEGGEVAIREILRTTVDAVERHRAVGQAMTDCVRLKPEVHSHHGNEQMSRIGG